VSNAIKYGEGRPVDVTTRREGDSAVLAVKDEGIGIAAADLEQIFERFERRVSSRNYGGFGLGLWVARKIVQAWGGTIRAESAPGKGSTFRVDLPLGESATG
jgi:signal transduction histidine kinase